MAAQSRKRVQDCPPNALASYVSNAEENDSFVSIWWVATNVADAFVASEEDSPSFARSGDDHVVGFAGESLRDD